MAYQDREKRAASFKHVSNILHTADFRNPGGESFESRHPIFSDRLLSNLPNVSQDNLLDNKIKQIRTWNAASTLADGTTSGTFTDAQKLESLYSGSFATSYIDADGVLQSGERPEADEISGFQHVEKVIIPLLADPDAVTSGQSTSYQFLMALDWSDIRDKINVTTSDSDFTFQDSVVAPTYPLRIKSAGALARQGLRLTNWLYSAGFGADYAQEITATNTTTTLLAPRTSKKLNQNGQEADDGSFFYGGYSFDPAGGTIQIGLGSNDSYTELKDGSGNNLDLPLWLIAYRYIGPTGSAAGGTSTNSTTASPGIITTLFSTSGSEAFEKAEYDYYEETTLTPTDSEDVLEYISNKGLTLSSSVGIRDHIIHLGSSSYYDVSGSFSRPRYAASLVSLPALDLSNLTASLAPTASAKIKIHAQYQFGPEHYYAIKNDAVNNGNPTDHSYQRMFDNDDGTFNQLQPPTEFKASEAGFSIDFLLDSSSIGSQIINNIDIVFESGFGHNKVGVSGSNDSKYNITGSNAERTEDGFVLISGSRVEPNWSFKYQESQAPIESSYQSRNIAFANSSGHKIYRINFPSGGFQDTSDNILKIASINLNPRVNQSTRFYPDVGFDGSWSGANIFAFNGGVSKKFPDLSSYGQFESPTAADTTTHSFSFDDPVRLHEFGVYYSISTASAPSVNDQLNYPDGITLYASNDNENYFKIASESNINTRTKAGTSPISSAFYEVGGVYMPDHESRLGSIQTNQDNGLRGYYISYISSSITTASKYSHYLLEVSGGQVSDNNAFYQYIHHVDLFENKFYGPSNRKQIHVGFDSSDSNQNAVFGGGKLSKFDVAVSESATRAGMRIALNSDLTFFSGDLESSMDAKQFDIQNVKSITASIISSSVVSASTAIINNLNVKNSTILSHITSSTDMLVSGSIRLYNEQPIFFTNKTVNGSEGVDIFSARMFGHYTNNGVSELYTDAYRIHNIADAAFEARTIHPTSGSINFFSNKIALSGSVEIGGRGANVRLVGTLSGSTENPGITGSGTSFLTDLNVGDALRLQSASIFRTYVVDSIQSDTRLQLTTDFHYGSSGLTGEPFRQHGNLTAYIDPDLLIVKNSAGKVEFKIGKSGDISASAAISASSIFLSDAGQLDAGTGVNRSSVRGGSITTPSLVVNHITSSGNISASGVITAISMSGDGSGITGVIATIPANIVSSSAQIAIPISGSFTAPSASFSTRVTSLEEGTASTPNGTYSSSLQTLGNITSSGNITASGTIVASNLSGTNTGDEDLTSYIQNSDTASFIVNSQTGSFIVNSQTGSFLTSLPANIVSSSAQIAIPISGSFTAPSASFSTRVTANDAKVTNSDQDLSGLALKTHVSGSFTAPSASFSTRVTALKTDSGSFSTRVTSLESTTDRSFNHITASGNISASGDIIANTITASGNMFIEGNLTVDNITLTGSGAVIGGVNTKLALVADDYWQFFANHSHPSLTIQNLNVIVNNGNAAIDFRVAGDNDSHLLFTDASEDKVAIGTDTVSNSLLTVDGGVTATAFTGSLTAMTGIIDGGAF